MVQIRPDELIRILLGELSRLGALDLRGYDENGLFPNAQAVTGDNSIGMGDNADVDGDYCVVGGGSANRCIGAGAHYGTICGGRGNWINVNAGYHGNFIGGGRDNICGGAGGGQYNAICGGYTNYINASYGAVGGGSYNEVGNPASGLQRPIYCTIGGGFDNNIHVASAHRSNTISGGESNDITTDVSYATIPGGLHASADIYGQVVHASGCFAATGDAQGTIQVVSRLAQASHVVNTWYALFPDGDPGPERITITPSTAWTVHVLVVGLSQNAAQQWGYELIGLFERDNAGFSTLAAQTQRVIFESDANYDAQLGNAFDAVHVEVRRTGGVDYDVRWVATTRIASASYP